MVWALEIRCGGRGNGTCGEEEESLRVQEFKSLRVKVKGIRLGGRFLRRINAELRRDAEGEERLRQDTGVEVLRFAQDDIF
jgi:hypothetical protein